MGHFYDGRSGYVFAVNPSGARYDGITSIRAANQTIPDSDGIWEAATSTQRHRVEVPNSGFRFIPWGCGANLRQWHFNVQRRIQRTLETDRWASPERQYLRHAGEPRRAAHGVARSSTWVSALTVRPSVTTGGGAFLSHRGGTSTASSNRASTSRNGSARMCSRRSPSIPISQKPKSIQGGPTSHGFPFLFPEKRTFFLEGDDIFAFGLGLNEDVLPVLAAAASDSSKAARCRSSPLGPRSTAARDRENFGGLATSHQRPARRR